jgi:hypothetical protein
MEAKAKAETKELEAMVAAARAKGIPLSAADVGLLRGQGIAGADAVAELTDADFGLRPLPSAPPDVLNCSFSLAR